MLHNLVYPIAPFNAPGKEDVCYWEDFLSDDDINYLLARPEWHDQNDAKIGAGDQGTVDKEKRRTNISWMSVDEKNRHIWEKMTNAVWSANRQFFQFDLTGCYELAQLGTYTQYDQGHYDWHTDTSLSSSNSPYRKLSMSLLLSDPSEFEGGELQVKYGSDDIKQLEQKKGRAWFFPSWTLHRVTPVTKGIRRSLVLWVGGPGFK
jgi:PKHD-type hydroxylase